jgi:hypothetical protein
VGVDSESHDTGSVEAQPGCLQQPAAPIFSPPSGTADPGTVTLSDPTLSPNGVIYYTTDGTNPTTNSPVYVGPIQVAQNVTFRAAAWDGCDMSNVVVASYTAFNFDDACCEPAPVIFVPNSQTQPNDFLVSLTYYPGVTICYTEDGSTPTCDDSTGTCTGTSQTYSAAQRVSINGSVTDQSTGQVTVTAMGCEAGFANGPPTSQIYTLQAAAPTMSGLVAGDAAGFTPTIQSVTVASVSPPNVPTIQYTTDGTQPTCTTGLSTANPTTFNTSGAPTLPQTGVQLQAVTCKTGYLPSTVSTWSW